MERREKDMQEQGADQSGRMLFFGIRHPLITGVLIILGILILFIYTIASSCGAMATAGVGAAASVESEGSFGYLGGSGEDYKNATATQKKIVKACQLTPAAGAGLCATWVYNVFSNAGFIGVGGNANDMWAEFCYTNDTSKLEVGMIIAVQHSGPTGDSWNFGHVGIYVGDDKVMHSTGKVEVTPLEDWVNIFDPYLTVKWGFPPAVKALVEKEQMERVPDPVSGKSGD